MEGKNGKLIAITEIFGKKQRLIALICNIFGIGEKWEIKFNS